MTSPIEDGYTEHGYIAGVKGLHPATRFTYRPITIEERAQLVSENAKLLPAKQPRNTARVIATKILSWDRRSKKDGKALEISADSLIGTEGRPEFKSREYDRLVDIVMGFEASDEDPEAPEQTKEEAEASLADQLEAAASGRPAGDVAAERSQKN